ncbi:hypothetical protein GUITHDRAFT_118738 [Guillardia theta CCMP2712]|uniref:Uncharacterized protein n=1 Tax=Guillardia theta (strain CCMP2712) TaxID=905079 RepID=L1IG66_GUITC|nr:hypothetical protein GUITHDRAFT_118738 [Guillardia theta CCMP2712]EKX35082.1 hypothetical protein GUITHDRAFT_118738 [Guillardia theta CCMP2712]|eukprot:XP_005822062.1 hypothetical protein GUITHDRAFT_118738 [Guillardia theta CCMP2712]
MASLIRVGAGAAMVYTIAGMPPMANVPIIASTRRAAESVFNVMFKTAKGTGRAAWYSATTLFVMVCPVLFIMDTSEAPSDASAASAALPQPVKV